MTRVLSRRGLLRGALAAGGLLPLGLLAAQGCNEETPKAQDRGEVLASFVDRVALPMLAALQVEADGMAKALETLVEQPSAAALGEARARWSLARTAFRRTVAFGIGPADDIAVTGGILDEPTDLAKLAALAVTSPPPDLTRVQSSSANTRGFLAIEALLFEVGATEEAMLTRFTDATDGPGRRALLGALGRDLQGKLVAVADGWSSGGFGEQLRTAGKGSSVFRAQRDAFDALLNQTLLIADRLLDILRKSAGIILDDPKIPTTDRSDRTLTDLADDLTGIEAVYTGAWGGQSGPSIGSIVAEVSGGADGAMRGALAAAQSALGAFAPPLRGAAATRATETDALLQQLRAVRRTLATEVFNALGVSVGISDKDGD